MSGVFLNLLTHLSRPFCQPHNSPWPRRQVQSASNVYYTLDYIRVFTLIPRQHSRGQGTCGRSPAARLDVHEEDDEAQHSNMVGQKRRWLLHHHPQRARHRCQRGGRCLSSPAVLHNNPIILTYRVYSVYWTFLYWTYSIYWTFGILRGWKYTFMPNAQIQCQKKSVGVGGRRDQFPL